MAIAALAVAAPLIALGISMPSPAPAMTRAQARGLARALNLTAADVPQFSATVKVSPTSNPPGQHCPGAVRYNQALAVASSPVYMRRTSGLSPYVASAVAIMPSAELARRAVSALGSKRMRRCAVSQLKHSVGANGITSLRVRVSTIVPPTRGWSGLHIKAGVPGQPSTISDVLIFARGRADVTLTVGAPQHPFSRELERHLSALLLARARKYIH